MNIVDEKKKIRSRLFQERKEVTTDFKSPYDRSICETLIMKLKEMRCDVVHCYIPMSNEIDIKPVIEYLLKENKTVVCPKTLPRRQLENRVLESLEPEDLEFGPMKTQHPKKEKVYSGVYDLVIVPGLAFDSKKFRVGYGGGYYDTFLNNHPEAKTVGVFYPFQEVESVPREKHDVCLDEILVNKELKY